MIHQCAMIGRICVLGLHSCDWTALCVHLGVTQRKPIPRHVGTGAALSTLMLALPAWPCAGSDALPLGSRYTQPSGLMLAAQSSLAHHLPRLCCWPCAVLGEVQLRTWLLIVQAWREGVPVPSGFG